jgi:hypothetical protein
LAGERKATTGHACNYFVENKKCMNERGKEPLEKQPYFKQVGYNNKTFTTDYSFIYA